jgi:hypothetical protein
MSRFLFLVVLTFIASKCIAHDIPLSEVASNREQKGLKYIGSGVKLVDGKIVEEDYATALASLGKFRGGASNIFLVDANNIAELLRATSFALSDFHPAYEPVQSSHIVTGNNWLAVYLGCAASESPRWEVQSVSVDKNTIRFTYRQPKRLYSSRDVVFYYYWVPIGALKDGAYNLELYDSGLKSVTLMRRVEIGKEL